MGFNNILLIQRNTYLGLWPSSIGIEPKMGDHSMLELLATKSSRHSSCQHRMLDPVHFSVCSHALGYLQKQHPGSLVGPWLPVGGGPTPG